MSINLKVEEYCHNCPDFEPSAMKQTEILRACNLNDPYDFEAVRINNTLVECKYKKRCAAQMRYLQKQHTEMMKKETGDE